MNPNRRVIGLDLSLTCTGIGICLENGRGVHMITDTITSKGTRAASLVDRHARLVDLSAAIVHHAALCDLAVIEAPLPNYKGGSPLDRHALWWLVVGALIRREVPVAAMNVNSLKTAIAGKGNADKAAVAVAVARLWPEVEVTSSDVSDAAGLAHLGAVRLGLPVTTLPRHREVKCEWPDGLPAPAVVPAPAESVEDLDALAGAR